MLAIQVFLVSCICGAALGQVEDDPQIVDAGVLGIIRGGGGMTMEENGVRRPYIQFRGIPYATIPQRFSPSTLLEVDHGNGDIYNATITPNSCYQPLLPEVLLTEDCLYLTVHTHQKDTGNDADLRPVLFFIHGGAFTVGQGSSFSGIRIMNRDVVYVSFNYRLGLLGFFSLQNDIIPGNAGMYDVVNALKWTNKYIKHFGGDPNSITIVGQSAGAVSVTELMVSPMAQGLFHRAIAASGSALNSWGTTTDSAKVMKGALDVSQRAECYDGVSEPDLSAIGQCMRAAPALNLVNILFEYQVAERNVGRLGFDVVSPVVQSFEMTTHPKFLPEDPAVVFAEGREAAVPLMMSTTKHDGSYAMGIFYNRFLRDNNLHENTTYLRYGLVPAILTALGVHDRPAGIHETIARTYLGDARHSGNFQDMYPGLMDIFSVFFFKGDCYQTALLHARNPATPTFWSSFEFMGNVSFWGQLFPGDVPPPFPGGVAHTDDLIYVFALTFLPFSEAESAVSTQMMSYWADFATVGRPHPNWPQLLNENEAFWKVDLVPSTSMNYQTSWVGPGYEAEKPITPTATPPPETTADPATTANPITTADPDVGSSSTSIPTSPPTQTPTSPPTQAPTSPPTQAPTSPPTQAPTSPPTQASTSPTEDTPTTQGSLRHHASYLVIVLLASLPLLFSTQ